MLAVLELRISDLPNCEQIESLPPADHPTGHTSTIRLRPSQKYSYVPSLALQSSVAR